MNLGFKIQHYAQHGSRNIYTIKFDDQLKNEFDLFTDNKAIQGHKDYQKVFKNLQYYLTKSGFREDYFNFNQKSKSDLVGYLKLGYSNLRLYCIVRSDNLIILGTGGIKTTKQRQGTKKVNEAFERMDYVEEKIYSRIQDKELNISTDNKFYGNLVFKSE